MGGGPSTAALAAAVSEAGGLGFLAAGYRTPDAVRDEIAELRLLTERPFGLNVFAPGPASTDSAALEGYADAIRADRKSTRLNSSHSQISYAVFCLKKK